MEMRFGGVVCAICGTERKPDYRVASTPKTFKVPRS
jgi:hypothetical protein